MNPLQFEVTYECHFPLQYGERAAARPGGAKSRAAAAAPYPASLRGSLTPGRADLEWRLTYVGSAEDNRHDQVLDSVLVGPVAVGQYRFVFQANPPNWSLIPQDDILGVTIIRARPPRRDSGREEELTAAPAQCSPAPTTHKSLCGWATT